MWEKMVMDNLLHIHVKNINDTLDYILEHHSSVARFGDGEMDIIAGNSIPYQDYRDSLANQLKEIMMLQSNEKFVVCLSDVFEHRERYNDYASTFWKIHLEHYRDYYNNICTAEWYGSTFISRPYMDLVDKSLSAGYFEKIRKLWNQRNVLIVEGENSRSGVGNDLFDNAASTQRILCPSRNAYDQMDNILSEIKRFADGKLILLMLGPTAKVLARQLSELGYQAIDLGHIDSEYEWYKMGALSKVKLEHKHTAEHNFDEGIEYVTNIKYEQQIVADLSKGRETNVKEKMSIIIPCYNVERYVMRCFESIYNQTYGFENLEVIFVDDCSTDNTYPIITAICNKYSQNVTVVKLERKGMTGGARNVGMDIVNTKYLTFLDADDCIHPEMIERLYSAMQEDDYDIVQCMTENFESENVAFNKILSDDKEKFDLKNLAARKNLILRCTGGNNVCVWAKLYSTDFLKKNNIRFLENTFYEDNHFTIICLLLAEKYCVLNQKLLYYYINNEGITKSILHLEKIRDLSVVGEKLLDEIKARKIDNDCYYEIQAFVVWKSYFFALGRLEDILWKERKYYVKEIIRLNNKEEILTNPYITNIIDNDLLGKLEYIRREE